MKLLVLNDHKNQDGRGFFKKGTVLPFDKISDFSRSMGIAFGYIKVVKDDYDVPEKKSIEINETVVETASVKPKRTYRRGRKKKDAS